MADKINPKMVTLARESRGLTQRELADRLKTNPTRIYRTELDNPTLGEKLFESLIKELHYPKSFFYQKGEAIPMSLNFRKRQVVAQKLIIPIEAQINVYRLNIEALFKAMKRPVSKFLLLILKKVAILPKLQKS